jgi:internalin A
LRVLDCSYTDLPDLAPLAGLTALESLDCSHTQVADLAPLTALPALRKLDCWGAPVSDLPEALIESAALEDLILSAGPGLAAIPAEVLSQDHKDNCLPRLRAHLADLRTGALPLRDLKVIILGNGRIGKTQICRRLRGEPFEPDADSTHGISVTSVELAMPAGQEPATLNLWDFGGQDLYHGTHALFMRTRAVFLLVWTPGSECGEHEHGGQVFRNRPLPYWLEYIRHLGGEASPVVLVQNQCDGGRGERANLPVDAEQLQPFEEDGRLFTRLAYSARDDSGRARLMDALQQAVTGLREVQGRPLIGRNRLAVWDQLRAWRDADAACPDAAGRRHRLLPYPDFESLCRTAGVHSPETFAEVLHNAGMVFFRRGLFGDQLVLDQSWALNAVYALFTREGGVHRTLRRLGGRFTRFDLDDLLWRGRGLSAADQESLLEMMVSSGVCFVHRRTNDDDATEYVAPDLLPAGRSALAEEIAARWDPLPGEPLAAAFAYPFLSPSIARAVLSNIGQLAGATALYWRYGLCLYDATSRASAIVEELPDAQGYGGQVRIQTRGAGAETLLRGLVERIAKLNERSGWSNRLLEGEMPRPRDPIPPTIVPAAPPAIAPAEPEVYVSYGWARERTDPLVGALCDSLAGQGLHIRRDTTGLQPGDRISRFMERLSAGRCVVVVLSAAYLRSESCMTELYRIYTNARQREDAFLGHIVPLVQDDARIGTIRERVEHAAYWKQEHDGLAALLREHGAEVLGAADFARFKLIGDFYRQVGDMLALANDVLLARDRPTLSRDGFAMVRGLIERALA